MPYTIAILIMSLMLPFFGTSVAEAPQLNSEADRISYSLGHQLGGDLRRQGIQADRDALLRGLRDGLAGSEPLLPAGEMQTRLNDIKRNIETMKQQELQQALEERRRQREQTRTDGAAFLAANAKKTGVITLPSGLQYRVIRAGEGRRPLVTDTVTVHYRSTLVNGDEFGSTSPDRPESFAVNEVIPGLEEALQLMQTGARWELYIPPELGFGRRGALEDQTLIYDVELLDIQRPDGKETKAGTEAESTRK